MQTISQRYLTIVSKNNSLRIAAWLLPVFAFAAFTAVGAVIRIPIPGTPVPVTLQTLSVLLSGALLGSARGSLSQSLYVLLGVVGMPFFAGGEHTGMSVILGPTGGYLIGFILAPIIVGQINRHAKTFLGNAASLWLCGSLVIFGCGLSNLVFFQGLSWAKALSVGFYPFMIGDFLKIAFASSLLTYFRGRAI